MSDLKTKIQELVKLYGSNLSGRTLDADPLPGDTEVYQISISGLEEAPVFVTPADGQILCICYLFDEDQVVQGSRPAMLERMLELNVPMPLSSFAKIDGRYAIFGALSEKSDVMELAEEIVTLGVNWMDAIEALEGFIS